jgi:hypothetical protein
MLDLFAPPVGRLDNLETVLVNLLVDFGVDRRSSY